MKLAQVRLHAFSLPEVSEEPHHHLSSFRVRSKIFVTFPPEEDHIRVFVDEVQRERALAMYPEFVQKLLWGGKVVGLRVALESSDPAAVKALVTAAWEYKSGKKAGGKAASTYVALLRGVNVGGAKRVPMVTLRDMLSGLGYSGVTTLLNSGNAVFRAPRGNARSHATAIANGISVELGLDVPVVVKSAEALSAIVAENPLSGADVDASRVLVAFAADEASLAALAPIAALARPPDRFVVGTEAAYAYCPAGSLVSPVGAALLGKQGRAVTTRNWATTLKLHALVSAA
jgi:uncharacterized protein (DUF1697 family)